MKSQCDQILQMLKRGPVTPMDALNKAGVFRLAARVNDLRNQGHTIHTDMIEDGDKRYASYRLVKRRRAAA